MYLIQIVFVTKNQFEEKIKIELIGTLSLHGAPLLYVSIHFCEFSKILSDT